MLKLIIVAAALQLCLAQQYQQKVAPGVPPQNYQNYQQPPPPPPPQNMQQQQQYQQQQQQYQPPPQQHQPPPQQQYQQQVPVQQVPVQQVPGHQVPGQQMPQQVPQQHGQGSPHSHHGDPQLLNTANMDQEKDHIQEHMEVPMDVSKMSQSELQFHYFKMHDADHNNKLDGCELIKSLIHWHAEQGHKQQQNPTSTPVGDKIFVDDELVNLIDPILNMDDHNKDGYIDYPEFVRAQQKSQQDNQGNK